MAKQRLLLVSDGPAYRYAGCYFTRDTYLRFVPYLARHVDQLDLALPLVEAVPPPGMATIDLEAKSSAISVLATHPVQSIGEYYRQLIPIFWQNSRLFWKAVRSADVVLLRAHALTALLVTLCARLQRKSVFVYVVGDERSIVACSPKYRGWRRLPAQTVAWINDRLLKISLRLSDGGLFLSTALRQRYAPWTRSAHFTFTNLVDDEDIQQQDNTQRQAQKLSVLAVGRFVPEKGFPHLLQALALVRARGIDCRLELCGDGPARDRLEDLAHELRITPYVSFLGYVSEQTDLDRIYLRNEVYALPSLSEGVPKTLLEAMAKGVAILATNVGGIPDVISGGENGLLVEPGCPSEMADALARLATEPGLRRQLVTGGYRFVRDHTASRQAARIASLILAEESPAVPELLSHKCPAA